MAFTGRLGTSQSQLGQIELGSLGATTVSASFTADAFIQPFFRADAVVKREQTASFTSDAVISTAAEVSTSFTADSFIHLYFRADAYLFTPTLASFTANAVIKRNQTASFTADAVKRRTQSASFTANAIKRKAVSASFTADAYIPSFRQRHARTGPHTGVDQDIHHTIAWAFDRYLRGESLQQVLIDIDARLTAREGGRLGQRRLLTSNAIRKATMSKSLTLDSHYVSRVLTSFTANAFVNPYFRANALIRAIRSASLLTDAQIEKAYFFAKSWVVDPAIYLDNNVLTAPTWPIDTTPRTAFIDSTGLTHDSTNDPEWWDTTFESAWAKFTLSSTKTVILDNPKTGGDSVIQLWSGGPGAWPAEPEAYSDDDVEHLDPEMPYPYSEYIEITLPAGTYWVAVHKYDPDDTEFNVVLRMRTTT